MILFDLKCSQGHRFEGWFRNGEAYEAQAASHTITCPVCGDTGIDKAPMAPRIAKGRRGDEQAGSPTGPEDKAAQAEILRQLRELRRKVEESADYVGERFAEEARRIHYGEVESRAIYGETSADEAERLRDEGVPVARIPWIPTGN